jgi:hypothetical protein
MLLNQLSGRLKNDGLAIICCLVIVLVSPITQEVRLRPPTWNAFLDPVLRLLLSKAHGLNVSDRVAFSVITCPPRLLNALMSARVIVSRASVVPTGVKVVSDPLAELVARGVELRILPNLWSLRDAVVSSSLQFSIIRMRNAASHESSEPIAISQSDVVTIKR